jgi:4'-phosphopantetheinyl transferase
VPADDLWLSAPERAEAGAFRVAVRRDAFRLRRWTARQAVADWLGPDHGPGSWSRVEVRREPLGAPVAWVDGVPAPLSLSLSDRAGRAVCAVGLPGLALGCDLERIERRRAGFLADFLTADEQRVVAIAPGGEERDLRAAVVWSAKEAALKALRVGLRRDTRSVEVVPGWTPAAGGWFPVAAHAIEGRSFRGWWRREQDLVLTILAEPKVARPAHT